MLKIELNEGILIKGMYHTKTNSAEDFISIKSLLLLEKKIIKVIISTRY